VGNRLGKTAAVCKHKVLEKRKKKKNQEALCERRAPIAALRAERIQKNERARSKGLESRVPKATEVKILKKKH